MSESKTKPTTANLPDGRDAFNIIAERLQGVERPVESLLKLADQFPAEHAFRMFAASFYLALAQYQLYLEADLAAIEAKLQSAVEQVAEAPRILTAPGVRGTSH